MSSTKVHYGLMQRDIKAIAFDIDGTLVRENFWGALNGLCGLSKAEDESLFRQYEEGVLEYRVWMGHISAAYRKNPKSKEEMMPVLLEYRFAPDTKATVKRLQRQYELALISSNIDTYVEDVGDRLSIPFRYAFSTLEYDHSGTFMEIGFRDPGSELEAKVAALKDLCSRLLLEPSQIAFVGDSRNDLEAFRYTGRGILLREGNEDLRKAAWKRISTLSELAGIL